VITTVPTDIPVCFLLGILLVSFAGRQIRATQPRLLSRFVLAATGFCAWFGMTVCYFYLTYPGWMWSYIIDERKLALVPSFGLFWLTLVVCGFAGAVLAQELIKAGKTAMVVLLGLYALGTYAAVMSFLNAEYFAIGTYETFHAGQAVAMQGHPIQGAMTIAGICEAIPALALAAWHLLGGRKTAARASNA
jgi:hypothetical protein